MILNNTKILLSTTAWIVYKYVYDFDFLFFYFDDLKDLLAFDDENAEGDWQQQFFKL